VGDGRKIIALSFVRHLAARAQAPGASAYARFNRLRTSGKPRLRRVSDEDRADLDGFELSSGIALGSRQEVDMPHTYQELRHKTVAELREMAKGLQDEAIQGYSQMNKERLLPALCRALKIDMTEHYIVRGIDKAAIKAKLRQLKSERDRALNTQDRPSLKNIRRQMHALKHQIRAHMS
jgi:hypothetical protein